jgi:hypothetical protein
MAKKLTAEELKDLIAGIENCKEPNAIIIPWELLDDPLLKEVVDKGAVRMVIKKKNDNDAT